MSHGNEMICQPVTLSGYAEWPKVAGAVIKATYGPERATALVRHALEAARGANFPIQKFGGTKHFLPQALAAWEKQTEQEAAREVERDGRELEKYRRQTQEQLAQVLEALPSEVVEAFENQAKAQLPRQDHSVGSRFRVKLK